MSALPSEHLERRPMSFEDYLALPEDSRTEYVDGTAIVSPAPRSSHQRIAMRLAVHIEAATGLYTVEAVGVWTGERRSRIPDVVATAEPFDDNWTPTTPVLVVEVLSPSTRSEDMLRKSGEYREAGIGQYWILDRDAHTLTILSDNGHGWDIALELDAGNPTGSIKVADHGSVELDLTSLLAN